MGAKAMHDLFLTEEEFSVFAVLRRRKGKERAIGKKELAKILGMDERMVRRVIKALIEEHGVPVGSDYVRGYFIVAAPEEVEETYQTLKNHALSILKRAAVLKRISLKRLLGQLEVEL